MKKLLLFVLIFGFTVQINAYEKKSLVERFTNASCAPCASINNAWYNVTTGNMVTNRTISHIIYNGWWPGSADPMYLLNQADNTTRINYYGVNSVPWIEANAVTVSTASSGALVNAVNSGNAEFSPFKIDIVQNALSNNLIELKVKVTRDPNDNTTFSNLKLRVALTEKVVQFASAPGSNGEKDFFSVCRKMLPNAAGTSFTAPSAGDSTEFILQYVPTTAFLNSVNRDSLTAVVFIQSDANQYVYQSANMELIPNFVGQILQTSNDVISANTELVTFNSVINNIGMMGDTYNISVSLDSPAGWTGTFTTVNGTYALGQIDSVQVPSSGSTNVGVTINPNGIDGSGKTQIQFSSKNNPGMTGSTIFRNLTTTGIDLLVVDAEENDLESYVTGSLGNVYSGTYGVVSRTALHQAVDLSNFDIITWTAGKSLPAFYPLEVTNLEQYLNSGGKLFITGQDIGNDIFGAGGQSQFAQSFYNNYLHANFIANASTFFIIKGIANDPISNGLQFTANSIYDISLDKISPYDTSATASFLYYNGPDIAGIKAATLTHGIVYLAFGLEQITYFVTRDSIVSRSINWLNGVVTDVTNDQPLLTTYSLEQNYPNPFNPTTIIKYQIPEASSVNIKVFDVLGKEVASLVNGFVEAGNYQVEFSASNLASGIYFYQMVSKGFVDVKKMSVLK